MVTFVCQADDKSMNVKSLDDRLSAPRIEELE